MPAAVGPRGAVAVAGSPPVAPGAPWSAARLTSRSRYVDLRRICNFVQGMYGGKSRTWQRAYKSAQERRCQVAVKGGCTGLLIGLDADTD